MRAIVYTKYGTPDVIQLQEVEKPVPNEHQVLVKVHAASVNPLDWHRLRGLWMIRLFGGGLRRPKITGLGADMAGRIEAVGKNVTLFRPGDEVFGGCGWGGGFAEYVCVSEKPIVLKPANLTFEEAAAVPVAAITALQALRDIGRIRSGQEVLINGASGGVGTFAVQIAKALGARVTGVCSAGNLDMIRSIGADHVVDYTREDCTRNGRCYDLIIDNAAYRPVSNYARSLNSKGIYVMVGGSTIQMFYLMFLKPCMSLAGSKKNMRTMMAKINRDDLDILKGLLEAGKVRSVIDRRYQLSEVADALRYLGKGHARGKVIITVG
jgi:NADPH:quinone reductase-like Zn-dependent oxidoreductase